MRRPALSGAVAGRCGGEVAAEGGRRGVEVVAVTPL